MTTWSELPPIWAWMWEDIDGILERYNRHRAHALCLTVDGVEVYARLLIPSPADLRLEATLYPNRATTQELLLSAVIVRLANRLPNTQTITVALLWGGADGVRAKPLVTFGNPTGKAA